jgi:tRNA (guanine37-N1)-methyltransferase
VAEQATAELALGAQPGATVPHHKTPVVYLSPQGEVLNHALVWELAALPGLILLCGNYEGIDERAVELEVDREVSIGDYVLTGGELPALLLIDAAARLVPGVLGDPESIVEESFTDALLEYPHYTRPAEVRGMPVPEVLLSGHHEAIRLWRRKEALRSTYQRRPDLLQDRVLSLEDQQLLDELTREGVPVMPVRCGGEG